jgi:glycosyltransferase involved in cell wall biosynthesis
MRVHLLSTPNVQVTKDYYLDVFSGFTRRFSELLKELGHTVFLYGSEEADVPVDELICCISKQAQAESLGEMPYQKASYAADNPLFQYFNQRAAAAIQERKEKGDLIATIAGTAQYGVWQQHQELPFLEYSIGYRGVCAPYRVYQSNAWRSCAHGFTQTEYGRPMDDMIYTWLHEGEFPERPVGSYLLYVGRISSVKGIKTACQAAEQAGMPLFLIGEGDPSLITYGEYLGHMPPSERNHWMAGATALLCPTDYIEPSATVVIEAQLCGTPVLSTPWGGFPEYLEHERTGYLCKDVSEFVDAIGIVGDLDRRYVRLRAQTLFGWAAGKFAYQQYFARLARHLQTAPAMAAVES